MRISHEDYFKIIVFTASFAALMTACNKSGFSQVDLSSTNPPSDQIFAAGPSSKDAGEFSPDCLNQTRFDACLIWKNPVAQRGSPYSHILKFGDSLPEQIFGVKLTGLLDPQTLKNASIEVIATDAPLATPSPTQSWRFPYPTDLSSHSLAQVMAYFWLTYQENQMIKRSGVFYAKNKGIVVDAYNSSILNNAYWDTQKLIIGVATVSGIPSAEMALGAEVYLHEMGHANMQFAVGRFLVDSNAINKLCLTEAGCIGAISEGIADFHADLIFRESTALGETWVNSVAGLVQNNLSRDVRQVKGLSISDFYSRSQGEIHGMGSAYASILWEIYINPLVDKLEFEKIFSAHLTKFTESVRFAEARDILLAEDLALFDGKYKTIITEAFKARGI